jgi:hypothetical protein
MIPQNNQQLPPWQTWGNIVRFERPDASISPEQQLVRVAYHRPESWRFLLWAKYSQGTGPDVTVRFNLYTGIGFSTAVVQSFPTMASPYANTPLCTMTWTDIIRPPKWTTEVMGPQLIDGDATSRRLCSLIVGQNIQISATVETAAPTPGFIMEVGAWLAPNVHVRPDWFAKQFNGGEIGGT